MGFLPNKKVNYQFMRVYMSKSSKQWAVAHMLHNSIGYAKDEICPDKKVAIVCTSMSRNEWKDEAKENKIFEDCDKLADVFFANEDGIDIYDIQSLAQNDYKMIMILDVSSINGTNNYKKLLQLSCISNFYDVDIRVADNYTFKKEEKFEEYEWYFADSVIVVCDDPQDENKFIYEEYEPISRFIRRKPEPKKKSSSKGK